jgi:hypothetical protein
MKQINLTLAIWHPSAFQVILIFLLRLKRKLAKLGINFISFSLRMNSAEERKLT